MILLYHTGPDVPNIIFDLLPLHPSWMPIGSSSECIFMFTTRVNSGLTASKVLPISNMTTASSPLIVIFATKGRICDTGCFRHVIDMLHLQTTVVVCLAVRPASFHMRMDCIHCSMASLSLGSLSSKSLSSTMTGNAPSASYCRWSS